MSPAHNNQICLHTILMADDNPGDRELTRIVMQENLVGCDFRCVSDGIELLDYLNHRGVYADNAKSPRPDLILLDLNMPRKSGTQALKEIKADEDLSGIPIVILTTSEAHQDILQTYCSGASGYVTKPVTLDGVRKAILPTEHSQNKTDACSTCEESLDSNFADLAKNAYRQLQEKSEQLTAANRMLQDEIRSREVVDRALREMTERFELAVCGSSDGLWDWEVGSEIVWYSPRFKELLQYEDHEFPNMFETFQAHLHPDDHENVMTAINAHLECSKPYDIEYRLLTKLGEYRWFRARGASVRNEEGTAVRMSGSIQDVTRLRAFHEQLEQANDLLEQRVIERTAELAESNNQLRRVATELARSNAELEQFANVASHDLQEPLRKIRAFGDRLKLRCAAGLDETGKDYLQRMENAASRMQRLINDLLAFSRVKTKAKPFEKANLTKIANEVLSDLEVRIEEVNAEIKIGQMPVIDADPSQIRQLFQNMIGNALKFTREGIKPVIEVSANGVDRNAIEGNGIGEGPLVQFCFTDNGIGFEEKYLGRIFKPFERLHAKLKYEGTGMGLAICRRIVERHSGHITATSMPNKGTTFIITLPVHQKHIESHTQGVIAA